MTRLTIGTSVYDDYDGLYFTVQANRMIHEDVIDDVEFLILDNHPGGSISPSLRSLASQVPRCRYVPFGGYASTAVRDLIFREATTDVVLCIDSHVLLLPGALRTLLDYFDTHPGCRDLVQGPMCQESFAGDVATHYVDRWGGGLWGQWAGDPRGQDPDAAPFEISMQGMGLFACRRDAWPGLDPRMRGHGGEEGYLHEKFRRAGGRVVCHPGVRWLHRCFHSRGLLYPAQWRDRARNYVFAFNELGWDDARLEEHLHELFDTRRAGLAGEIISTARTEARNPFTAFDAVFCLHGDRSRERWEHARRAFVELGIDWLVEPILVPRGGDDGAPLASLRAIVASAQIWALSSILLLDDDHVPQAGALDAIARFTATAAGTPWDARHLADGDLEALAVNHTAYEQIVSGEDPPSPAVRSWLAARARHATQPVAQAVA